MANAKDTKDITKDTAKDIAREMAKDTRDIAKDTKNAAEETGRETVKAAEATTRRAAEAARQVTESAAETGRTAVEQGAEAGDTILRTGAEIGTRSAETVRATTKELSGAAFQIADRTTEQMTRVFGLTGEAQTEVARQTKQNLDVMVQTGSLLMNGWQSIWKEWLSHAQETVHRRVDAMSSIMRSRDVRSAYATQSELLKDEITSVLNRSVKVSELSATVANDAVRKINDRAEQGARQAARRI